MGMTMTQKILAAHAGLPSVSAGQLIEADLDLVLGNDITSPVAIHEIGKMNVGGCISQRQNSTCAGSFCYRIRTLNRRSIANAYVSLPAKMILQTILM